MLLCFLQVVSSSSSFQAELGCLTMHMSATCRGPSVGEVFAWDWPLSDRAGGLLQKTRAPRRLLIEAGQRVPGHLNWPQAPVSL